MNPRIAALLILLGAFSALSLYAMYQVGYWGIWQAGLTDWGSAQILADLVVACLLIMGWMVTDARHRGLTVWPYLVVTLAAGCFGPLLYLLRRELAAGHAPAAAA